MNSYTLDERSFRRLQAMLRWFEGSSHTSHPGPTPLLREDPVPPQWLLEPLPAEGDVWKIRVWYGNAMIGGTYAIPSDEKKYVDVDVSLEVGEIGYVVWGIGEATTKALPTLTVVLSTELSKCLQPSRVLGKVTKTETSIAIEQYKIDEIETESILPWRFTLSEGIVTFSDCIYMRGPVTVVAAVPPYTIAGSDGIIWVAVKINTNTGACEIIEGKSLDSVVDTTVPEDEYIRIPLLRLIKETASTSEVTLSVTLDLRRMMNLTLYV